MNMSAPAMPAVAAWFSRRPPTEVLIGLVVVISWIILAILAPLIAADPYAIHPLNALAPPSLAHPFGTDPVGRDVFSRVMYGARIDILIAFVGVLAPSVIGMVIGLVAGYFKGVTEAVLMRIYDVAVAFPFFVLVLAIVGMLGPGVGNLLIAVAIVNWVTYARLIRAEVMVAREAEYVLAARTLGYSSLTIMFRHVLPNSISPIVVYATTDAVLVMLAGATLGFLGMGVQPPFAEWGVMIANGQTYLLDAWWICLFPALALISFGVGLVLISDGLGRSLRGSTLGE